MSKEIPASEVEKHNTRKAVWIVIRNEVYDVTAYLKEHPGGEDPLLCAAGMDATTAFELVGHSADAKKLLKKYKIGELVPGERCSRLRPQIWMPSAPGTSVSVYQCEDDVNPWRQNAKPFNESLSPDRSKTSSLHKTKSRTGCSLKKPCCPKRSENSIPMPCSLQCCNPKPALPIPIPIAGSKVPPQRSNGKMKWVLVALAAAVVAGVAYKKFAS